MEKTKVKLSLLSIGDTFYHNNKLYTPILTQNTQRSCKDIATYEDVWLDQELLVKLKSKFATTLSKSKYTKTELKIFNIVEAFFSACILSSKSFGAPSPKEWQDMVDQLQQIKRLQLMRTKDVLARI